MLLEDVFLKKEKNLTESSSIPDIFKAKIVLYIEKYIFLKGLKLHMNEAK